jgi:hypothetical protein
MCVRLADNWIEIKMDTLLFDNLLIRSRNYIDISVSTVILVHITRNSRHSRSSRSGYCMTFINELKHSLVRTNLIFLRIKSDFLIATRSTKISFILLDGHKLIRTISFFDDLLQFLILLLLFKSIGDNTVEIIQTRIELIL